MIERTQRVSGLLLLGFGSLVLVTSLLDANKVSVGDTTYLLSRRMYVGRTILPDNVFYPAVMLADRIKLDRVSTEEKIILEIEYADRRFKYATALLDKKEPELAFSTLSKSQKYLFLAADQMLTDAAQFQPATIHTLREALDHSIFRLEEVKPHMENYASSIDALIQQSRTYLKRLDELEKSS